MTKRRRTMTLRGAVACSVLAVMVSVWGGTSFGSSNKTSSMHAVKGGIAVFAEAPGASPNYILPFITAATYTVADFSQFQPLLYRPLYWFGLNGTSAMNDSLSLAYPPIYSGRTVTVKLKNYKWSDGEALTATDVVFWMHMLMAEKHVYGAYVPGRFPDNVVSVRADSATELTFTLNNVYGTQWFTGNEIGQVIPIPEAWDKTSASAAAGSGGCAASVSKCAAVYTFLNKQAEELSTYASNPLWAVVDGPWRLSSFNVDGRAVFVPNTAYSGPVKPKLSEFIEVPFTSETSEYNVLRSGNAIQVGYVPLTDAPPVGSSANAVPGYTLAPWIQFAINYIGLNFKNKTVGPLFQQLYIRQALQYLIDQEAIIRVALRGYGYLGTGPVPPQPPNDYTSPQQKGQPYPYNPQKAEKLLKDHGWSTSSVPATCVKPGTGPSECGAGVTSGEKLNLTLMYSSGITWLSTAMQQMQSAGSQVGFKISLATGPNNSVIDTLTSGCTPSSCSWQLGTPTNGSTWIYGPYPSGDQLFQTGASYNWDGYSNTEANKLIENSLLSSSVQPLYKYENYVAGQLPDLWLPGVDYQVTAVANNLKGVTPQNVLSYLTPEDWYFVK